MSKISRVTINKKSIKKIKGEYEGVPIFFSDPSNYNDIYMLIRDIEDPRKTYKIISLTNGHVQTSGYYSSVYDFYEKHKDARFYDIEVIANEI